ncbi:hypothetical protein N7491_008923 [Penicillium cf. griseofulvum]|uniref:Uncharacterized protein n=1 Tax=Penicillium cf. griseofulvum TaxID=2972120 RepID=A0A9W9MEL1_9EURO|nr:hypothetical protein N7472_005480 [Penicillium cf. griseofulvum]KAJ5423707.1 hypothetical protein N7491_008923 [Penicillium cf. griseofulvum]KAJ5431039.1 hypothetical protein N7445_008771 [Penicillium cf. griseofulvum]
MPRITSREVLRSPLPNLLLGPYHTISSALHLIHYIGPLAPWADFRAGVLGSILPAGGSTIYHTLTNRDIHLEQVYVSDETGVQGRFQQAVGHVLGAVSGAGHVARGVNIRFADFKSVGLQYNKTPDVAIVSRDSPICLLAVGELKVPWVEAHAIPDNQGDEDDLCATIGQLAEYMIDLKLPYGFHSTYNETIFLRQVNVQGVWTIEYSEVINDTSDLPIRQCFWYLAQLAAAVAGQPVNNTIPKHLLHGGPRDRKISRAEYSIR